MDLSTWANATDVGNKYTIYSFRFIAPLSFEDTRSNNLPNRIARMIVSR